MGPASAEQRLEHLVEAMERRAAPHSFLSRLRNTVPFLVSAAILFYYFRRVNWAEVRAALQQADLWLMVPARVLPLLIFWSFDAYITQRLLLWFDRPFRLRDIFWIRGALYLVMLVNVGISNGGMFLYLLRKTRLPLTRLLGIQLFRAGLSLWGFVVIFTAALIASHFAGLDVFGKIPWRLLVVFLALGWLWLFHAWTFWQHGWRWWPINLLIRRDHALWQAFAQARPAHWLKLALLAVPLIVSNLGGLYLCAWAFGIRIPLVEFVILIPLVLSISNLPIAFGGFGTTTLAWQLIFPTHASPDTYLAFTLAYPVVYCLTRAAIGLFSLKPAWAEWSRLSEPPAVISSEATSLAVDP
jgi:uncharacterized membrane protein YbhN (UPF0104 family)